MEINTDQDGNDILNEIKEKQNKIDPIFKFARNEYRSRYDLVPTETTHIIIPTFTVKWYIHTSPST